MIFSPIVRRNILHLIFRQVSFDNNSEEEIFKQLFEVSFVFFGFRTIHFLVAELDVVYDYTKPTETAVEIIAIPVSHICKLRLFHV